MSTKSSVTAVLDRISRNSGTVLDAVSGIGGRALSLLSGLLSASLILYSGYVLYDTFYTQNQAYASSWELLQYRPEIIDDGATPLSGADTLAKINEDYRAWLTVYDTRIDYPVMQGDDDLYYASHDIYGNSSLTGAIYLAAGNTSDLSDNYNLLYGHHMDNNALFGGLDKFKGDDYFQNHREGVLVTKNAIYDLYTFAVIETDAYESMVYSVGGDRNLDTLRAYIREHSVQLDWETAQSSEKIAAFSTCRDAETSGRLVVFARMTLRDTTPPDADDDDDDEEPTTPPATAPVPGTPPGNPPGNPPATPPGSTTDDGGAGGDDSGLEEIDDGETPLARLVSSFQPSGSRHGARAWALVNLICLVFTAYILLPLLHLKAKFSRARLMKKVNAAKEELREAQLLQEKERRERERIRQIALENRAKSAEEAQGAENAPPVNTGDVTVQEFVDAVEVLYYQVKKFMRRFRLGIGVEVLDVLIAFLVFIWTENMRLPMVLIDRWTPLMILFLLVCIVIDIILARYRNRVLAEEEEDIRDEIESVKATT